MGKRNQAPLLRLTLTKDSTHERIRTWRFSRVGAIGACLVSLLAVFGIVYALLALTPLRTTIPGYPDAHFKRDAIANAIKIDSLENEMARWSLYAGNLARVLSGEQTLSMDSLVATDTRRYLSELSREELERRDSLLRATVVEQEKMPVGAGPRELPIEGQHFFTPLKGALSQGYDAAMHPAVDISAPAKSVVCAVLDGTIIDSGWTDQGGYSLILQHNGGIISVYRHNQTLLHKSGDKVKAGEPIALVGATGSGSLVSGDHLHFELWYRGQNVDPTKYCSF